MKIEQLVQYIPYGLQITDSTKLWLWSFSGVRDGKNAVRYSLKLYVEINPSYLSPEVKRLSASVWFQLFTDTGSMSTLTALTFVPPFRLW